MTYPRRLLPNMTHAITRRTAKRCLFLKPTPFVNQVTLYCLGLVAQRYGGEVALHAFMSEVTHTHSVVTDLHREGELSRLPDFFRGLHSNMAHALNAHYGRGEAFWCPGSYSNTEIHTETSLVRQILYVWTQPVRDGLVSHPDEWIATKLMPEDIGKIIFVRKPEGAYFGRRPKASSPGEFGLEPWQEQVAREQREAEEEIRSRKGGGKPPRPRRPRPSRSKLPEIVSFRVPVPPGYEDWPLDKVRKHFRKLLDREVERIHAERVALGKRYYMGLERIMAQDARDSAGSTFPSFSLNPRIACAGDMELRIRLLTGLKEWRADYRRAYEALREGREVPFPPGTYGRLRFPRACVRPKPPPDRNAA